MDLPLDIWKLISLYLDFNQLALNNTLKIIYDEDWFKNKILMKYPNCKQYDHTWKDLYKRSLKSGNIVELRYYEGKYTSEAFFPSLGKNAIEGFKIAQIDNYFYMILTFDGDLYSSYLEGRVWINKLLDSNVKDITDRSYIKENKWYLVDYNHETFTKLILETDENFIALANSDEFACAITKDKLYCYYMHEELIIVDNCNNNIDLTCGGSITMILHYDGKISRYDPYEDFFETLSIKDVKNIYPDVIKLKNDNIMNIIVDYENDKQITTEKICNNNKLQGTIGYYGEPILLINDNVCKYNTSKSSINSNLNIDPTLTSLTLIRKNVKNIYGWLSTHFIII